MTEATLREEGSIVLAKCCRFLPDGSPDPRDLRRVHLAERRLRAKSVHRNGCRIWLGAVVTQRGRSYGRLTVLGRNWLAHRFAWVMEHNLDPAGVIDHVCRNTLCVNPLHLEDVTRWENTRRGISPAAQNARKTHCVRGHQLPEYVQGTSRTCQQCRRETRPLTLIDFFDIFCGPAEKQRQRNSA